MKNQRSIFVFLGFAFLALFVCIGCGPLKAPRASAPPPPGAERVQPSEITPYFATLASSQLLGHRIGL